MDGVTPGIWTLSPGMDGYDAACAAALMACGVDPESFETYSKRLKAQGALRKLINKEGYTPQEALAKLGPNKFLTANSESGHQCQNACFQGARKDPCTNVPPTSGDPNAPSAFGYSDGVAPCTDHHGKSNVDGTTHGIISMQLDKQWPDSQGKPLTQEQLKQSVKENAAIHVDGNVNQKDGNPPTDPDVQRINNAQQANADRLLQDNPDAKALIDANPGTDPGAPADASSGGPSDAIKNFAAECQVTDWEQKMTAMRMDSINRSPIAQSDAAQTAIKEHNKGKPKDEKIKKFSELPQEKQKEVVEANRPKLLTNDDPPKANPKTGVVPPEPSAKPKPTKAACRKHQGNYLAWQLANGDGGGKKPPGWAGQVPPGASGSCACSSSSGGGNTSH